MGGGRATVTCPFVRGMLSQDTARAVAACGMYHRFVELDPGDEGAYGRLVRALWQERRPVIIVEQDVVPTPGQLQVLQVCGHDWCSYSYDDGLYPRGPMFGCVRLSGRLMEVHPHAAEVALVVGRRRDQEAEWWRVDALMARDLMIRGVEWFEHDPPVAHHHCGPPSGPP